MKRPKASNIIYILAIATIIGAVLFYWPKMERQHQINKLQNAKAELQEQITTYNWFIKELWDKHDACSTQQSGWHNSANSYRTEIWVRENQIGWIDYKIAELVWIDLKQPQVEDDNDLTWVIYDDSWLWRVNSEWKRHKLYNLQWTTVWERTKSLLQKFWLWKYYQSLKIMWDESDIKMEVAVCIAFADTSLWKAMKSQNNVWNVGNNDRWDVIHLDSIDDWFYYIYKTLNNKYLQQYKTIWELSQWGRTVLWLKWCAEQGEYCYATSPENWNNNIINCIQLIHRYEEDKIDEKFLFRK